MSWLCRTLGHRWRHQSIEVNGCVTTERWKCKRCSARLTTHDSHWTGDRREDK